MNTASSRPGESDYHAARHRLAHRARAAAILDVEGPDRVSFLQGQLTQDVRGMAVGQTRPAAGLTARGKLLYIARVAVLRDSLRLLLPATVRSSVLQHLTKYAAFQKVSVVDRSDEILRFGLYGPEASHLLKPPGDAWILTGEGEFSAEILAPSTQRLALECWLTELGSVAISMESGEALRLEAGRPRFGADADQSHLADEVGLEDAISTTKGCYVGQEIVARLRTYGRVNRRLVGFRFPEAPIAPGALLRLPEQTEPGKIEWGRVTSSAVSPARGPIGLGYAFRDVAPGATLVSSDEPLLPAIVTELPFS